MEKSLMIPLLSRSALIACIVGICWRCLLYPALILKPGCTGACTWSMAEDCNMLDRCMVVITFSGLLYCVILCCKSTICSEQQAHAGYHCQQPLLGFHISPSLQS